MIADKPGDILLFSLVKAILLDRMPKMRGSIEQDSYCIYLKPVWLASCLIAGGLAC